MNKKRFTALALVGFISAMSLASACTAYGARAWTKDSGSYQMTDGTSIQNVLARGIDVSHWKQNIDWNAVADDDVQFVMLGTRYNNDVDPYFRINADGAHKAGVKLGAYIYSYATTTEMAIQEADFVLDLIKDYPISYPVAFDVEASVQSTLAPSELSAIINAFCQRIADAGYYPMLYANDYWLANKIDMSQVKYDVWVARYEIKHSFANPAMWQATSTGRVNGVEGNVDIDFQYKDFSGLIPANQWRQIGDSTYYYQDYQMQKNTWIDDGNGWYYMNTNGNPSKGWLNTSEGYYYLEDSSGKMISGWKYLNDTWYHFSDNGLMSKGWVQDGDSKYFMMEDGTMKTGWMDLNGMKYYLKSNGAMATGWRDMDGAWYYFNPAGDMARGWTNMDDLWYYLDRDGKMQTGWLQENGNKYYLTTSGKMVNGWQEIDGGWYYFNGSGHMQTGFININSKNYYLDPSNGKMAADTNVTIDGVEYHADSSGVCEKVVVETETETGTGEEPTEEVVGPGAFLGA